MRSFMMPSSYLHPSLCSPVTPIMRCLSGPGYNISCQHSVLSPMTQLILSISRNKKKQGRKKKKTGGKRDNARMNKRKYGHV